jgi:hypothetical protein
MSPATLAFQAFRRAFAAQSPPPATSMNWQSSAGLPFQAEQPFAHLGPSGRRLGHFPGFPGLRFPG